MLRKWCVSLTLLVVIPGLLLTVSCAKKQVEMGPGTAQISQEEAARAAEAKARAEEQARKRAIEEAVLAEKNLKEGKMAEAMRQKESAKNDFLYEDVYFSFDSSNLDAMAQALLKRKADWMWNNAGVSVVIEGHCDERGTTEYNLALGERRARKAKEFLVDLGISPSRVTTVSFGEEKPKDFGQNEEAWAKNRRAHMVIR